MIKHQCLKCVANSAFGSDAVPNQNHTEDYPPRPSANRHRSSRHLAFRALPTANTSLSLLTASGVGHVRADGFPTMQVRHWRGEAMFAAADMLKSGGTIIR